MKLLTKDISKRAYCNTQKEIKDITNVITDIDSITATNNYINNSITDLANGVTNIFVKKSDIRSQDYGHN